MLGLEPRLIGPQQLRAARLHTNGDSPQIRFGSDAPKPPAIDNTPPKPTVNWLARFIDSLGAHNDPRLKPVDPYPSIPDIVNSFADHEFHNSEGKPIKGSEILNYFIKNARTVNDKRADQAYIDARTPEIQKKYGRSPRSPMVPTLTTKHAQVLHEVFKFSPEGHRLTKMMMLLKESGMFTSDINIEEQGWTMRMTDHAKEALKISAMTPPQREQYMKTHYKEALKELLETGESKKVPSHIAGLPLHKQRNYLETHYIRGQWVDNPNFLSGTFPSDTDEPKKPGKKYYTKEDVPMSRVLGVGGGFLASIIGGAVILSNLAPQQPNKPQPAVTTPVNRSPRPVQSPATPPPRPVNKTAPATSTPQAPSSLPTGNTFADTEAVLNALGQKELLPVAMEIDYNNGFFGYQFQAPGSGMGRNAQSGRSFSLGGLDVAKRAEFMKALSASNVTVNSVNSVDKIQQNTPNYALYLGGAVVLMLGMQMLMSFRQNKAQSEALKQMPQQHKDVMGMTKHTGYIVDQDIKDRFSDIGGNYLAKQELQDYLAKVKRRLAGETVRLPKGMALEGPPGNGKTAMARALAGEAGLPFVAVNGADFQQIFVGVGPARMKDLFKIAREEAEKAGGAIIFIDEIDAIGKARSASGTGGEGERESTLNALLTELDGFRQSDNIFVLCATNRYDMLDPALKRAGRFTQALHIPNPRSDQERGEILTVHIKRIAESEKMDVNLDTIVPVLSALCRNNSGADMMQVVNNGFDIAQEEGRKNVTFEDFVEGFQSHMFGKRPKISAPVSERERQVVGHHEHGHGITGMAAGLPPLIVSMFERQKSGHASQGRVFTDPRILDERMQSFKDYMGKLMMITGGHAAELQKFGVEGTSTGWSSDLGQIRNILRHMMSLGMFGNQFARDISDSSTTLTERETQFMDLKISQALATAIEIIEKVGPEKMQQITDLSLAMPKELVGEAAPRFYQENLGPEVMQSVQSIAGSYIKQMAEEASFKKPQATSVSQSA